MVSCPNYTFETIAWLAISCMTGSFAGELFDLVTPMSQQKMNTFFVAWVFTAVAAGTMAVGAVKKHKSYKKIFGTYPSARKAIVPFVL